MERTSSGWAQDIVVAIIEDAIFGVIDGSQMVDAGQYDAEKVR
jgi:hypothetical protein